jgi:signal transduction histidine kinase
VEAVVNLVDNAVKFTHERGHVWVTLEGSPGHPRMMVADDGPGIPAAIRADVFRRFYRAETSRTTAGNGLGLSLVDAILRLHGFTVVLHDNDPGCRIEVRLWNRETEVAGAAPLPDTFEPISPG